MNEFPVKKDLWGFRFPSCKAYCRFRELYKFLILYNDQYIFIYMLDLLCIACIYIFKLEPGFFILSDLSNLKKVN